MKKEKIHSVGVVFPIPNGRALEAAKDLASDVRKMGAELLRLHHAIISGEATNKDAREYESMRSQIQGMAETHFYDVESGVTYRVGDYVTRRTQFLAGLRKAITALGYERIKRVLH